MIKPGTFKFIPAVAEDGSPFWYIRRGLFRLSWKDLRPETSIMFDELAKAWGSDPAAPAEVLVRAVWHHGHLVKATRRLAQAVAAAEAAKPRAVRWP